MALLSKYIAWDLTGYDVDGPVPVVPQDRGAPTRSALLSDTARAEGLTIRQLYQRIAGGRGHYLGMIGGVLLLTALQTLLAGTTLPHAMRDIIFGLVVLGAVLALRPQPRRSNRTTWAASASSATAGRR